MHIEKAVLQAEKAIADFKRNWYEEHHKDPVQYPLELPEDNSGLWFEFISEAIIDSQSSEDAE